MRVNVASQLKPRAQSSEQKPAGRTCTSRPDTAIQAGGCLGIVLITVRRKKVASERGTPGAKREIMGCFMLFDSLMKHLLYFKPPSQRGGHYFGCDSFATFKV